MDALKTTPTVEAVTEELAPAGPVPARRVVDAILARHTHDYPVREIHWPEQARAATVEQWLAEARDLLNEPAHPELHGRAVILALALADPVAGREIVRSGLWYGLIEQLPSRFVEGLTPLALERLEAIPVLAAMTGVAMGTAQLDGRINDLAFNPSGQLIVVGTDRGWTLVTRPYRREIRRGETPEPVTRVGWSRDGRALVVEHGRTTEEVSLRGDQVDVRVSLGAATVPVDDALFSAVSEIGGQVTVWSRDEQLGQIAVGGPVELALSADGATLATRDEQRIALWDVASGRQYWSVPCDGRAALAISPDGTRVAAAGAQGTLLDAATGATVEELADRVDHVVFSDDGTRLALGCSDGSVWVANPRTGMAIARLAVTSPVTALRYAQDGEQLVAGTEAGLLVAWAGDFAPLPRRRLAAYSADDTRAADDLSRRLEIDPDVDALAALLAARTVDPPLSVGLFGDWGSGKTFFMRRLRRRIAELATDARDSGQLQRDVAWHKRIVQIDFNAWHYAEGNLWASLVEHILDNLRLSPDEDENLVERRRRRVVEQITDQRAVTTQARQSAEEALAGVTKERDDLERDLEELKAEDPLQTAAEQTVRDAVLAVTAKVLTARDETGASSYEELGTALGETRATLTRGSEVLTPLLRDPRRGRRIVALLALLALAPAVAALVGLVAPAAVESLAGVAAFLGGVAAWVQRQAAWTRDRLDEVERAADELAEPARVLQREREAKIEQLQADYDAKALEAEREQRHLEELERELEATTASRLLARLIADRVESDDYRRHLGVLALVRRDFEAMSDYLRIGASEIAGYESLGQEEADDEVRVGRIVLYIDDLDRCEPAQVVAVLQAVHLLLAFPLFTVVVGVDVRWVERALRLHHQHLLDTGDGAKPRDYLEKIFQIPFRLEPLSADASKTMLRGMLGAPAVVRRAETATPPQAGADGGRATIIDGEPSANGAAAPARASTPPVTPPPPRDLQPLGLEITEEELTAMDELAPLLGRSPRALKRFVNTYRLIKVRAEDPVAFLHEAEPIAPYRAALLLLALVTGRPQQAGAFLDAILDDGQGLAADAIDAPIPWPGIELPALKTQAEEVVRFTFHWPGQT